MKDKPIHEILGTHLIGLSLERREDLLAQWTWQAALAKEQFRNMRSIAILSGVFGLAGVLLGASLGFVLTRL